MIAMHWYWAAVALLWISGSAGASVYASRLGICAAAAIPVTLALLTELSLYLVLAFPEVRRRCEALVREHFWALPASAAPAYLIATVPTGTFSWERFAALGLCAAAIATWYRLLPVKPAADAGFLLLVAGTYISGLFRFVYPPPAEGLRIEILGQLLWIRFGVASALWFRRMEGVGFGFWPHRREWLVGVQHFVSFLPVGLALTYGLEFARLSPAAGWWWKWPATFAGILWVVALGEEFFFRGLLQQWLSAWLGLRTGIVLAAVAFGAVHLPFREFPNWRFAVLAATAGWFYGRAFVYGRGVRAAMVTHALTVATWRVLFR